MSDFTIATWNVNSLKVRLPQVLDYMANNPVDVLCLQETKLDDEAFPRQAFSDAGLHVCFTGQKTYNGVAIISRTEQTNVQKNIPHFEDAQQRLISATIQGIRIICAYMVNGQDLDSDKFVYKMNWLTALHEYLGSELKQHNQLALLGDFNIAPDDRDVHDPAKWLGGNLVSPQERGFFQGFLDLGLSDAFRLFEQTEKSYSWWDYRQGGFRRNAGLRIDHILLSKALAERCTSCVIDKIPRQHEQPSDHTPVLATIHV
ncbi:exodeoxyribonuclease III [Hydromonas duriensis]|uniref:Exodeoxyribonuclease III n=1 Tax=Hydromonas duriensis TaxID=1527608 RepID=A0A4R6Y8E7_9BURK|nr:exodeoxyribonuclease III [Hydromonas duriensis]TDR31663.1 exodeoxyribonuclease III [Hydromonas duriensis]